MSITIARVDHFVLTVADLEATADFYTEVLGMDFRTPKTGPKYLLFGQQKINLHQAGQEFEPRARLATPGSGDFCLITENEIGEVVAHLTGLDIDIEVGPAKRLGALGPMMSVYFRDPDHNLVEVSKYL